MTEQPTYETADDVVTIIQSHNTGLVLATPLLSAVRPEQHQDFATALRAARSQRTPSPDGGYLNELDVDLADNSASPYFARLSTAIDRAVNNTRNRRFG